MYECKSFKTKMEIAPKEFDLQMFIPAQMIVEVPVFDPATMNLIAMRLDSINGEVI